MGLHYRRSWQGIGKSEGSPHRPALRGQSNRFFRQAVSEKTELGTPEYRHGSAPAWVTVRRAMGEGEVSARVEGVPGRVPQGPVVVIVPRRNIETWFAYLDGSDVDEHRRYSKLAKVRDCEKHAKELYIMCHERQSLRDPAPSSLREACDEYNRFAS